MARQPLSPTASTVRYGGDQLTCSSADPLGPYLGACLIARAGRRHFLQASAALGATFFMAPSAFAQTSEIHDLSGNVKINGVAATYKSTIKPGDEVVTGSDGYIVFVIGEDAFMLRSRSQLRIQPREDAPQLAGLLSLLTGAMGAVFKKGARRQVRAGTITAGIRGTGVYVETRANGTYFCTCWGSVDVVASDDPADREVVESRKHTPRLVAYQPEGGSRIKREKFETHSDREMDILAKCVNRRSPILVPEWFDK